MIASSFRSISRTAFWSEMLIMPDEIIGSRPEQLSGPKPPELVSGLSPAQIARMEKEMEQLEQEVRAHQEGFGENSLRLNAAQRYVKRLLDNPKVLRFLSQRHKEILDEFREFADLEAI